MKVLDFTLPKVNTNEVLRYMGVKKPTLEEIKDYCLNVRHNKVDYQYFIN